MNLQEINQLHINQSNNLFNLITKKEITRQDEDDLADWNNKKEEEK